MSVANSEKGSSMVLNAVFTGQVFIHDTSPEYSQDGDPRSLLQFGAICLFWRLSGVQPAAESRVLAPQDFP